MKMKETHRIYAPFKLPFWLLHLRSPTDLGPGLVYLEIGAVRAESGDEPWEAVRFVVPHALKGCDGLKRNPMLGVFCVQHPHEPRVVHQPKTHTTLNRIGSTHLSKGKLASAK